MRLFKTPADEVHSLRFSPDGRGLYLLSHEVYLSPDGWWNRPQHAYRIDVASGEITGNWPFKQSEIAVFSPDLRTIYYWPAIKPYAWPSGDNYLHRLNLDGDESRGSHSYDYDADAKRPDKCSISADGRFLALVGSRRGDVDVIHRINLADGSELAAIHANVGSLAYSRDGQLLAVSELSTGVTVWSGTVQLDWWPETADALTWSADGRLAWGRERVASVARPGEGTRARSWGERGELLSALDFAPDGWLLLSGTQGGVCAVHDTAAGAQLRAFEWGIGPIYSVAFSPDGLTCAAGGEKGQVVVWDVDA
jgi:WD40 repeat protein